MEIVGLPGGMAARHFGMDALQWRACAEQRARVLEDLGKLLAPSSERRPDRREGAAGPESA